MRAVLVLLPLSATNGQTAGADTQSSDIQQTFRSGVELVALTVTVEKPDGSYVADLGPGHFRVLEEGVLQDVHFFGAGRVPVDLVLLIDTSSSMNARLTTAQQAALNFIQALGRTDRAAIMSFGSRINLHVPFTADRAALETAVRQLDAGGTTALYNAMYVAINELGTRQGGSEFRRRALVVLTDGDDTASLVTFDSVVDLTRRVGVAIYTIALGPEYDGQQIDRFAEGVYEMRTFARETGGKSFFPAALDELEGVYEAIALELAHQYTIGYMPDRTPAGRRFRRVSVQVDYPNATVRTRSGYIAG